MMWIRSQNRTLLLKCSTINLGFEEDSAKYCLYELLRNGQEAVLGLYKSKERALEVLDDIQRFLIGFPRTEIPFENLVYQMPQE